MNFAKTTRETVALCDASGLPMWLLKGRGADAWLVERNVDVPAEIYASTHLAGGETGGGASANGAWVTRTGADEFLIESKNGERHQLLEDLASNTPEQGDLFAMERQDAVFVVTGELADNVMSQTCGIDWERTAPDLVVMTRVAGVSCSVRRRSLNDTTGFVLRLDPTYGIYLWDQLLRICEEEGGGVVGTGELFGEMS